MARARAYFGRPTIDGRGGPPPRPEPELGLPMFARPNSVRVIGPIWTQTALFRKYNWAAAEMTLEERSDLILAFARFCTPTANPPTRR